MVNSPNEMGVRTRNVIRRALIIQLQSKPGQMTVASQRASLLRVPLDRRGRQHTRCRSIRRAALCGDVETMETGPGVVLASRFAFMKLCLSRTCSLSPHIVSREAGIPLEYEQVDNREKKTKSGADFWSINPKGYVPVLEIDNGQLLTEGPAIVQYLADQKPASGLMPAAGTLARYHVQEWLNFVTSELHKILRPDFPSDDARRIQEDFQGEPRQALRLARQAARRQAVPDGRHVHRRRRLSVHGAGWTRRMEIDLGRGRTSTLIWIA